LRHRLGRKRRTTVRSDVFIPIPDGTSLHEVVAVPDGVSPADGWAGVVIVHEVFGVTLEMLDVGDRFAARNWVALLPDLFSHGSRIACLVRAMRESQQGAPGRVSADIEAARAWLAARPDVDGEQLGVVVFCMGGGFALTYAASRPPGVRAAAVNYGQVPSDRSALRDVCPIVGSYGGRDRLYGPHGHRLRRHLEALDVDQDVKTYPHAGHSFMTNGNHPIGRLLFLPMRLGYAPDDSADAWDRTFTFLERHIRSGD
jgi:carboxymethylenebutenolidase